jgi:AAA15 family ATPase/GTPase
MNNSILKFSVENYESIRTKQSMRFVDDNLEKIKIICVFGANSAGKSNFFTALYSMISLIKLSYQNNTEDVLNAFTPFLLNTSSVLQPTTFSLTYRYEDEIFLYSFSFFKGKIINESLKRKSKKINK